MKPTRLGVLAAVMTSALVLAACADTLVEVDSDTPTERTDASGSIEAVTTTTVPIVGTTAELLTEMATGMSQLSAQIADEGDEQATLRRIDAIWLAARPEVESNRRDISGGIQTTVDMARNAVVRIRPADADKAFKILTDLVDRYTGDG
ncbi:MAG TPA: hypothetical protein VES40_16460 [Ilumatobacteraceae bacterium]|nr:hypothetical protein [Ilumatobacteraceae bacterium]